MPLLLGVGEPEKFFTELQKCSTYEGIVAALGQVVETTAEF